MRSIVLFLYLLSTIIFSISDAQEPDVSLMVARNDGSLGIGYIQIQYGVNDSKGNFFYSTLYPDNVSNKLGPYVFYEVIMGIFTDYLIPAIQFEDKLQTYSNFNVLGGGVRDDDKDLRVSTYSPVSPLDALFDGVSRKIPNRWKTDPTIYGTSYRGFIHNGTRDCLSGWGSSDMAFGGKVPGGCCFINPNGTFSWGLPYTIIAHKFAVDYVYLGANFTSTLTPSGEKINVFAYVLDAFGRVIPEAKCNWNLTRSDTSESIVSRGFNFTAELANFKADNVLVKINASMISPGVKTFWYSNKSTHKAILTNLSVHRVQRGINLLNNKALVTRMLRFTNPVDFSDVITAKHVDHKRVRCKYFDQSEENDVRPRDKERMTCKYSKKTRNSYNWVWKSVSNSNGIFGGGVLNKHAFVQYLAFAFHNPVKQLIKPNTECPDNSKCSVYVNGEKLTIDSEYEPGWYQVIVRMNSKGTIPEDKGFKISFGTDNLVIKDAIVGPASNGKQSLGTLKGDAKRPLSRPYLRIRGH